MPSQNLVSASLASETKAEILQMISQIRGKMNFLLTMAPEEIKGVIKAGNSYGPFIEHAYETVNDHPGILPGIFDVAEFKRDYQLSKDLVTIMNHLNQLSESVNVTHLAVTSDALVSSLEVYSAVKTNREKVPGLFVMAEKMGEFFKKTRKKI